MIAPHPAGRLGWRLRVYLAIVAARSLGMGVTYWASAPRIWRSPAFDVIEQLAPLRTFASSGWCSASWPSAVSSSPGSAASVASW
jgi:hypothetical protein